MSTTPALVTRIVERHGNQSDLYIEKQVNKYRLYLTGEFDKYFPRRDIPDNVANRIVSMYEQGVVVDTNMMLDALSEYRRFEPRGSLPTYRQNLHDIVIMLWDEYGVTKEVLLKQLSMSADDFEKEFGF